MAHHMIGYSVSYRHDAFRTSVEPEGIRRRQVEETIEGLAQSLRYVSRGRWIVVPENGFLSNEADAPIDLVVYVPAGDDQYEQMLTAVNQLEQGFNSFLLTEPIDTSLRTIEGKSPGCVVCGGKFEWLYPVDNGSYMYFCDTHARRDRRFGDPSFIRTEVVPSTT